MGRGRLPRLIFCAACALIVSTAPVGTRHVASATANLTWNTSVTVGPVTLARPAVAVGQDGNIYAFGGTLGDDTDYNTTFIYQPSTNTWSMGAPMPVAREGAAAVTLPDGRIAVIGGGTQCEYNEVCSNGTVYNRVDIYTPSTNSWASGAPMLSPRYRFTAALFQGHVYAIGGSDGTQAIATVESYDPVADTWSPAPSLPQPTLDATSVSVNNAQLDVFGGFNGVYTTSAYDTFLTFDGSTWSYGPSLPQATEGAGATLGADGQIYLVGGFDFGSMWLNTLQVFNPSQGTWTYGTTLPSPTCCAGVVTAPSGQIYVVNGGVSAGSQVAIYGPSIAVNPLAGQAGSAASITGADFAPDSNVSIYWGSIGSGYVVASGTTDNSGAITQPISFTVPATATPGTYTLTAIDDQSQYPATTSFVVASPGAGLAAMSTGSGPVRQAVKVSGTSFKPGEKVSLYWDKVGRAIATTTADGSGTVNTSFSVPSTTAGSHRLIALGLTSRKTGARSFSVTPATHLAHRIVTAGSQDTLYVSGFSPLTTVSVYWRSIGTGGDLLGSITTNASGAGSLTFTTPSGSPAEYNVMSVMLGAGGLSTVVLNK